MTPSPLELLLSGRYHELLAQMHSPESRGQLLAEVVGAIDVGATRASPEHGGAGVPPVTGQRPPPPGDARVAPTNLSQRQLAIRASGDYAWGLLSPAQRRSFLVRDIRVVQRGSGNADAGAAQLAALERLRGELSKLYETLDVALRDDDLDWLLPLAENLVSLQEITGDFATALQQYEALLATAQRLDSLQLELHARLGLSVAHSRLGDNRAAQAEADAAADLAQSLQAEPLLAAALHMGGSARAMQGDFEAARYKLNAALALRRRIDDRHGAIATMSNLAFVEQSVGDSKAARALLTDALAICRELGDRRGEALFLQNLATLAYAAGDLAGARELYEQSLAIQRATGDRRGEAGALSGLGYAAYAAGELESARELQSQALAIARELDDRYGESTALIALGNVSLLERDHAAAAAHFRSALGIATESGDRPGAGRCLYGLGNALLHSGDAALAAQQLAAGLALFLELDDESALIDGLAYSAPALCALARWDSAALALAGALQHAELLGQHFDPVDLRAIEDAQAALRAIEVADQPSSVSLRDTVQSVLAALQSAPQ